MKIIITSNCWLLATCFQLACFGRKYLKFLHILDSIVGPVNLRLNRQHVTCNDYPQKD
jgi:hypothetical protein